MSSISPDRFSALQPLSTSTLGMYMTRYMGRDSTFPRFLQLTGNAWEHATHEIPCVLQLSMMVPNRLLCCEDAVVGEQAAEESKSSDAGQFPTTRIGGIWEQGSITDEDGGAGRDLRSHNGDSGEDSRRTQGSRQSVRIREATKGRHHAKAGTSGYTYAHLVHETHGRLGDEAKEQIRILADEACCHSCRSPDRHLLGT